MTNSNEDALNFQQFNAIGSMGTGIDINYNTDEQVGLIETTKAWANKHLSNATATKNVKIITGTRKTA